MARIVHLGIRIIYGKTQIKAILIFISDTQL